MNISEVVPLSSISSPEDPLRVSMDQAALEELARSIATVGLISPPLVKRTVNGYEVIAGHRRLMACRLVGLSKIPVLISEGDAEANAAAMLVENVLREDLTPVEEAQALRRMREVLGLNVAQLADRTKKSEAWVRGRLELLDWPLFVLQAIAERQVKVSVVRPLMAIENTDERDRLLRFAIESGVTARVAESWAAQARGDLVPGGEASAPRVAGQLGMGDFIVKMPCWLCRQEHNAIELAVARLCSECVQAADAVKRDAVATAVGGGEGAGQS